MGGGGELHGPLFVIGPEGGFSGHAPDVEAKAIVPFVHRDSSAVVGVPSTGIEGLPARLTVGMLDVGAWDTPG